MNGSICIVRLQARQNKNGSNTKITIFRKIFGRWKLSKFSFWREIHSRSELTVHISDFLLSNQIHGDTCTILVKLNYTFKHVPKRFGNSSNHHLESCVLQIHYYTQSYQNIYFVCWVNFCANRSRILSKNCLFSTKFKSSAKSKTFLLVFIWSTFPNIIPAADYIQWWITYRLIYAWFFCFFLNKFWIRYNWSEISNLNIFLQNTGCDGFFNYPSRMNHNQNSQLYLQSPTSIQKS